MGAWGPGAFDNDHAMDFIGRLCEQSPALPPVEAGLACERGEVAIAAAEVVAALVGEDTDDLPEELVYWLAEASFTVEAPVLERARETVCFQLSPASAIFELSRGWDERHEAVTNLSRRLARARPGRAAPRRTPPRRQQPVPRVGDIHAMPLIDDSWSAVQVAVVVECEYARRIEYAVTCTFFAVHATTSGQLRDVGLTRPVAGGALVELPYERWPLIGHRPIAYAPLDRADTRTGSFRGQSASPSLFEREMSAYLGLLPWEPPYDIGTRLLPDHRAPQRPRPRSDFDPSYLARLGYIVADRQRGSREPATIRIALNDNACSSRLLERMSALGLRAELEWRTADVVREYALADRAIRETELADHAVIEIEDD